MRKFVEFIFENALKMCNLKTAKINFTEVFVIALSYPKSLKFKMPYMITET